MPANRVYTSTHIAQKNIERAKELADRLLKGRIFSEIKRDFTDSVNITIKGWPVETTVMTRDIFSRRVTIKKYICPVVASICIDQFGNTHFARITGTKEEVELVTHFLEVLSLAWYFSTGNQKSIQINYTIEN